jgi:DNA repair ATPase RecN
MEPQDAGRLLKEQHHTIEQLAALRASLDLNLHTVVSQLVAAFQQVEERTEERDAAVRQCEVLRRELESARRRIGKLERLLEERSAPNPASAGWCHETLTRAETASATTGATGAIEGEPVAVAFA